VEISNWKLPENYIYYTRADAELVTKLGTISAAGDTEDSDPADTAGSSTEAPATITPVTVANPPRPNPTAAFRAPLFLDNPEPTAAIIRPQIAETVYTEEDQPPATGLNKIAEWFDTQFDAGDQISLVTSITALCIAITALVSEYCKRKRLTGRQAASSPSRIQQWIGRLLRNAQRIYDSHSQTHRPQRVTTRSPPEDDDNMPEPFPTPSPPLSGARVKQRAPQPMHHQHRRHCTGHSSRNVQMNQLNASAPPIVTIQ
jgi:hypothetical protein